MSWFTNLWTQRNVYNKVMCDRSTQVITWSKPRERTYGWCFSTQISVKSICESLHQRVTSNYDHTVVQTLQSKKGYFEDISVFRLQYKSTHNIFSCIYQQEYLNTCFSAKGNKSILSFCFFLSYVTFVYFIFSNTKGKTIYVLDYWYEFLFIQKQRAINLRLTPWIAFISKKKISKVRCWM